MIYLKFKYANSHGLLRVQINSYLKSQKIKHVSYGLFNELIVNLKCLL